jgi:hypothetical protein
MDSAEIEKLNGLADFGYRLTKDTASLAERLLAKDHAHPSVRLFSPLGSAESLGHAIVQLGMALAVFSRLPTLIVNASGEWVGLDHAFGSDKTEGLTGLLGTVGSWEGKVIPTRIPELAFLPFGSSTVGAPAVTAKTLTPLLDSIKSSYPQIILIGPRSDEASRSSVLLCADEIFGVVASGETTQSQVAELRETCLDLEKAFAGVILCHV